MKIVNRDEVIKALIEDMKVFEEIISKREVKGENEDNKDNLLARIKNGPTQLSIMGLLPYITFIVSKYEPEKDKQGYTKFLLFIIYILNKLEVIKLKDDNDKIIQNYITRKEKISANELLKVVRDFLYLLSKLSEGERRILEKDLLIILEEMKKIYVGLYDSKKQI